jgi:tetratricopeptide (TPR) repeat protein
MKKVNEYYKKGMDARAIKDTKEAGKFLKLALDRLTQLSTDAPKKAIYPLRKAEIYTALNAHKYAENELLKAIRCDKRDADTLFLLGNVYLKLKDFQMAVEAYDKFFLLDEKNSSKQDLAAVCFNRAIAKNGTSSYDEALDDLEKVDLFNPEYPGLAETRKAIHNNKLVHEVEEFSRTLDRRPRDWNTFLRRANHLHEIGNNDLAIKDYKTVLENQANNVEAIVKLGITYYNDNQHALALDMFQQAKKVDAFHEKELVIEYIGLTENILNK